MKLKWYLQTWFIALMISMWLLVVPAIIGIVLLILQQKKLNEMKKEWDKVGFGDLIAINEEKDKIKKEIEELENRKKVYEKHIAELEEQKKQKESELVVLDDELLLQSFGLYEPKYNLTNSEEYKKRLDEIRNKQKQLVREKRATDHFDNWSYEGSVQKGRAFTNNNIKMVIRAFNAECDEAISKVKFNNVESMEKRIRKAYDTINKINRYNRVSIRKEYLDLKLEELYLAYEYEQKKREEQEEQRLIKERMREEKRVQEEIERMKKKIEKEEQHFNQAIKELNDRLAIANDQEKAELEKKIKELEEKLAEVKKAKRDVEFREQNTRAGYVYIISNIGSFGENVYKIGMTRRLEPMDRVKELGDASVPFPFDVHAMIFSEDAPKLEQDLHNAFNHKRVNLVNERKEFFNVALEEIERVVKEKHNKTVEFTKLAEAEEYRKTLALRKKMEE
ncbi:MAG TPA: DUF4041 domain-containing protein, partial [Pseudothermotoga sp.]